MDEIIQILIFATAMIASVVIQAIKNKKKPQTTSPKDVLEDIFPEIDVELQNEQPADVLQPVKPIVSPQRKPLKEKKKREVAKPVASPSEPVRKESKKIHLSNRQEAKRAFIYSEIFNRKY